jgi:hypothetical protein
MLPTLSQLPFAICIRRERFAGSAPWRCRVAAWLECQSIYGVQS